MDKDCYYVRIMDSFEKEFLMRELTRNHWNRKLTSIALGVSYRLLLYRIKHHHLEESACLKDQI